MKVAELGFLAAAGALLLAALYIAKKGVAGAAAGAVGAVADAAAGTVVGIGQVVGIPATNMTKCQQALADGRMWDASFDCPAGTYIDALLGRDTVSLPTNLDPYLIADETARLARRYPAPPKQQEWGEQPYEPSPFTGAP